MKRFLALALISAAVSVACGGSNPASPSASSTGATVNGSIVSIGGLASTNSVGRPNDAMTAGMTVSVVGTDVSSAVDNSNRFTLRGVPSGSRQLKFSSATVNATLDLSNVQSAETISMEVSVTSTSAVIESVSRSAGSSEELEGRIESIPASPAGSLVVAGRTVTTDVDTRILQGSNVLTFAALAVGQRVHVKGTPAAGSLLAKIIDIQNTNVDIQVPINGIIENFTGTASAFQFEINDRLIKGDNLTEFFGNSDFSDIADGKRAEVKGLLKEAYVYADRMKVESEDDDDDDDQDQSASIEGTLMTKGGSIPNLTLLVGTTTVLTNSSTDVQRKGDNQDLSVLELGMTLHVIGARQSNGSIIARRIQIKDDATGGILEIEGSMGGVSGTCTAMTFGVNGYSIFTDGSTTFTPACAAGVYKSGTKVKVKGVVQAGGSVKATSVDKQ